MTDPLDKGNWADPWWRLNHLYSIVTDDAAEVRFTPNEEQANFYRNLWWNDLILKARQLGFTTFVDLIGLDQCLFNANFQATIIADTRPNAEKIFRNKVLKPYERLKQALPNARHIPGLKKETSSELIFDNDSSIAVGVSARGGTNQFLHVSEMGKIARKYPDKAREIVTGAFESVPRGGFKIVESTAEGRSGWFYDAVQTARKRQMAGGKTTPLDFRLHFYPWWSKRTYRMDPEGVIFTDELLDYFTRTELLISRKLDLQQRAWYVKKLQGMGHDWELMKREYPSHPDEAFEASTEGLLFWRELKAARLGSRIGRVPVRANVVVNSWWDLGLNDTNTIWLEQKVGAMHRFVGFIAGSNEGMGYYADKMEKWRKAQCEKLGGRDDTVRWGRHYLPHDGDTRIQGYEVMTRKQILEEQCSLRNIEIVPRVSDKRDAIAAARVIFPECEFDEEACAEGIKCLDNYSREWNEDRGEWLSYPRHDWASHGADSFLQFGQWHRKADEDARGTPYSEGTAVYPKGGY